MSGLPEKILLVIESEGQISSLKLAEDWKEDHQKIVGAIKSLLALGEVITAEQTSLKRWELTPEGEEVAEKGSHEGVVFKAIPEDGIAQSELMKLLPNAKVGFSKAMSQGWIVLDKTGSNGPKIRRKVDQIEDSVQSNLQSLKNGGVLDDAVLVDYKKRKLVQDVIVKSYLLSKGENFSTSISKQETDLTPELIASGAWREKSFKPYNLNALGVTLSKGHLHPLLKVREEYRQIFLEMGFSEMPTNNYVESSFWNFDALFQPQQHPARDAHDTFFISEPKYANNLPSEYMEKVKRVHSEGGYGSLGYRYDWKVEEARKNVLRTHTTAVSSRMLYKLAQEPVFRPVKYFSIDRVFRNETLDATHLAEFHQIEGVAADYGLTLGDLIGVIYEFFKKLGIEKLRFKPAYNPYTEPSMEVFSYHPGLKKWVEIGNSGLFRPELLLPMGLPEGVNVIAWGLSLERPTMIKYGIDNIRDLVGPRVNLQMVYDNPICRLDKHGQTKLSTNDDTDSDDLEAEFNSIWTRASQLAQELNFIRKNAGLEPIKIPTFSELIQSQPATPGSPSEALKTQPSKSVTFPKLMETQPLNPSRAASIPLNGIPSSITLVCDPAYPPIGIRDLLGDLSKVLRVTSTVHVHSSVLGQNVDRSCIAISETPGQQLRVTLIFMKVGKLSKVTLGSKVVQLSQADVFRLFVRLHEAVCSHATYENASATVSAELDEWLQLQEEYELQDRRNVQDLIKKIAEKVGNEGWLVGSQKTLGDTFLAEYLLRVNGKYPALVSSWIKRSI